MQNTPTSDSGFSRLRILAALLLVTFSAGLAMLSFAANPAGGTVAPSTTQPLTWQGTGIGGGSAASCTQGTSCDAFKLTISGTPGDWAAANKKLKVRIQWLANSSDYDLEVRKGSFNGPVVASAGAAASANEELPLDPASPSVGTGDFYVVALYFAATAADQYNGAITVVESSASTPATPATGVAPRYMNYTGPAAGPNTLGKDAGEPSIGVNWTTETGTNGGRSMFIAETQTLRVTFDDTCATSPSSLWEDKSFPTTSAITFDPILFTDNTRANPQPRTIVSQLIFGTGTFMTASAYTNSDGDLWLESTGAGIGQGIDHQTIGGGGPFHAPLVNPAYPNAVYYCAQLPGSACALSLDGGQTFGPAMQTYQPGECGGLHGHIKVGPDGTAYLPNKGCGIEQAVIVSEDNGLNWQIRRVPGSSSGGSDPAVAIGRGDEVPGYGRVYLAYADGDTRAVVATSDNGGRNWSEPVNVGAAFGINNVAFPTIVAGDDDRAAIAFYGTPTQGPLQDPKFTGVWHLYVATTYDGGATWHTVNATPNDPMQRGCIWLGGGANICRNMLDFFGIDVDKRGRVLVGYNDGCAGAECVQAPTDATGNSYTAVGVIARQTGGKGLFAAHDNMFPDASVAPGAPAVSALRNGNVVHLSWSTPNNGGSPITGYTISRGTSSGGESFLLGVPGSLQRFTDAGANDPNATYYYTVQAINAFGSSCGNNEVQARYVGNSSTSPGYGVLFDPNEAGPQTANPDLDIERLSIHEPTAGVNAGKLVINLKVANLSLVPNDRMWRIIWDSRFATGFALSDPEMETQLHAGKFYVGMTKDEAGTVSFEYGSVLVDDTAIAVGIPVAQKAGAPDAGSFTPDGLITIVISKDKIAQPKTGDLLGNFEVRTYNTVSNLLRTNNAIDQATGNGADKTATANDLTANAATYMLVGPVPGVADVVSRKTHGAQGTFEISLLPGSPSNVEPRRGSGANNGDHQIVFRFLQPVTFSHASVSPPGPPGSGVSSTSANNVPSNEVIVNLTGMSNPRSVTVTLHSVTLNGGTANVAVPVGFLLGDTNGDKNVNSGDAQQTRNRSGQVTEGSNFRSDVNTDGVVNSGDAFIVRGSSGSGL